jgi:hypothetical protein
MMILKHVMLGPWHLPTGVLRHSEGGRLLPTPASLQIAKFDNNPVYYLLYLDSTGEEMTDTDHPSLEEAMAQAQREFQVQVAEWQSVLPPQ